MARRIGRWSVLVVTALCLLLGAATSRAAIKYVAKHGLNGNDGSQATPWGTIQFGVTNILPSDSLYVGEGTYTESVTNPASFGSPAQTNHSITLKGGWNTNDWSWDPKNHPSIINPGNTNINVLTIMTTNNTVAGFTLAGGKNGLLLAIADGTLYQHRIANCIISNNAVDGIYIQPWGKNGLTAVNCLIVKNGGNGIRSGVDSGNKNCLANCTIAYNGINGVYSSYTYDTIFNITNCIVAFNRGAGLRTVAGADFASRSCIFSNAAGNITWTFVADNGVIQADPKFVDAANGDFHLQNGSPCVGYGKDLTGAGLTNDLENTARTAPFDMGCYQSANTPLAQYSATYVSSGKADDSGDGSSLTTAKKTIGAALAVTAPKGTCNVAAGIYPEMVIVPYYGITLQGAGSSQP